MIKYLFVLTALFISLTFNLHSDEYADKLDELMSDYDKIGMFSGVVQLAKDGNVIYQKSFGYADWENKIPNNTETLFNIGSINKVFTHALILQLQKEGKLDINDPLSKYVSIYPDNIGSKITINMLLEMKAGLGDYLEDPNYNKDPSKFKTVDDYLELIKHEPLVFEPGTDRKYSNSGYAVLGGVIEKVTGKSYLDNLKERFLAPLGMNNTHYARMNDITQNRATGTELTFTGKKLNQKFEASPSPAGGMFSTAADLLKFETELRKTNIMGGLNAWAGGTQVWNAVLSQMKDGYTLIVLSNFRLMSEEVEKRFRNIMKGQPYPPPELLPDMKFYKILKENGISGLETNFKSILKQYHQEYNDMHLNMFGYQLMEAGEKDMAIEVFNLNVKLFPNIPNVYDSLGEAYINTGNKDLAIKNYKKVLELDPGNNHAKQMVEKLSK